MELPRSVEGILICEEQSHRRLKFGDIRGETESMVVVDQEDKLLQEEKIERRYYKCRLCKECEEGNGRLTLYVQYWQRKNTLYNMM